MFSVEADVPADMCLNNLYFVCDRVLFIVPLCLINYIKIYTICLSFYICKVATFMIAIRIPTYFVNSCLFRLYYKDKIYIISVLTFPHSNLLLFGIRRHYLSQMFAVL